jgi:hypothetical protein
MWNIDSVLIQKYSRLDSRYDSMKSNGGRVSCVSGGLRTASPTRYELVPRNNPIIISLLSLFQLLLPYKAAMMQGVSFGIMMMVAQPDRCWSITSYPFWSLEQGWKLYFIVLSSFCCGFEDQRARERWESILYSSKFIVHCFESLLQ